MNIFLHPYDLEYKHSNEKKGRQGALLKVFFKDGLVGYADCHPWPEVGDKAINEQIHSLQCRALTPLLEQSFRWARLDAEARKANKSLLGEMKVPKSHFFISDLLECDEKFVDQIIEQGFTHVKMKLGNYLPAETAQLLKLFENRPLKLRLDFNEKLSKQEFFSFLKRIEKILPKIDFFEDPIPYDPQVWKQIQESYGIKFAVDKNALQASFEPDSAAIFILKPALHSKELFEQIPQNKIIVTTYLDHPLGQLAAAYTASLIDPKGERIHGLLSHYTYHQNAFSNSLSKKGPNFTIPTGPGFGFDKELEMLVWEKL